MNFNISAVKNLTDAIVGYSIKKMGGGGGRGQGQVGRPCSRPQPGSVCTYDIMIQSLKIFNVGPVDIQIQHRVFFYVEYHSTLSSFDC